MAKYKYILDHATAFGDAVVFSALPRDLKRLLGDDIEIDVRSNFGTVFSNNPYLTPLRSDQPGVSVLKLGYIDSLRAVSHSRLHFITSFHRDFQKRTGITVPITEPHGDIHLTEHEKTTPPISGRYWVMMAGGKTDAWTKHWRSSDYQIVVNQLAERGINVAQSGARGHHHVHRPLEGVLDLLGWGGHREFLWQLYHAEGIICPITCAMHVGGVYGKPVVVIAGGREEPWWEWYTNRYGAFGPSASPVKVEHRYLHTIGRLDCCATKGCWKSRIVKTDENTKGLCWRVINKDGEPPMPECLDVIKPAHVVNAVLSYYEQGILPPI